MKRKVERRTGHEKGWQQRKGKKKKSREGEEGGLRLGEGVRKKRGKGEVKKRKRRREEEMSKELRRQLEFFSQPLLAGWHFRWMMLALREEQKNRLSSMDGHCKCNHC